MQIDNTTITQNYKTPQEYTYEDKSIIIDLSRDDDLTEPSLRTLKIGYVLDGENSPQETFARVSCAFADDSDHAQRLYDYVSKQWFGYASPILSNGGTKKGLPISCFLNSVGDSLDELAYHMTECISLSTQGGGIGGYWGNIRPIGTKTSRGGETSGIIPFLKWIESFSLAFKQGPHRRGSYAAYLDISHPEIEEFILLRKGGGADANRRTRQLHTAVNIPDTFMEAVKSGAKWQLINPHTKEVEKEIKARDLFMDLIEIRMETGEPYFHFIDTTNKHLPKAQKDKGLRVNQSNLCSEVTLISGLDHHGKNRTAVCCLSSINVEYFNDWKDHPLFIEDLVRMLDNALQCFIDNAPPAMKDAAYSAQQERAIGLGQMGMHYYLQKHHIPFESAIGVGQSKRISKHIQNLAIEASKNLAKERGEAPDMIGTGMRHSHLIAIAPTASNSLITDTSPSVEPFAANSYVHKTVAGSFPMKNKYLKKLLEEKGKDTPEVWVSINAFEGSVQHLDFLSKEEKDVFKTAIELDQSWVVEHAAKRQEHICQAQSINLFFDPSVSRKTIAKVHVDAWKKGLKTLYYCRSQSIVRTQKHTTEYTTNNLDNEIPGDISGDDDCLSCSG